MKIGIFLSRDNGTISDTIAVDALAEDYNELEFTKVYDSFFNYEDQQDMLKTVDTNELDTIVLAGNSPKYYESIPNGTQILDDLKAQGINHNKIVFVNLKEQVALPHAGDNEKATKKARLLIDVALASLDIVQDIETVNVVPRQAVMIIGTTPEGILAARKLLDKDYRVYVVEPNPSIRDQHGMENDILPALATIKANRKTTVFFEADLKDVSGWCGDYNAIVSTQMGDQEIAIGGIIVAVGDDTESIKKLQTILQLAIDDTGFVRRDNFIGPAGETRDPGIWYLPPSSGSNALLNVMGIASYAVLSLTTTLDKNEIQHPIVISTVNSKECGGCGTCVKTCAFTATSIDHGRKLSITDPKRCNGCGNCVVACPTGARDLVTFPVEHILLAIHMSGRRKIDVSEPKVLALLCNGGGYPAADSAGTMSIDAPELKYSPNVIPLRVECGGNVDTQYILQAFDGGFDGVAIMVCHEGNCVHVLGNTDMHRRLSLFHEVLESRHIDDKRLRIIPILPNEGKLFSEKINAFCHELKQTTAVGGR